MKKHHFALVLQVIFILCLSSCSKKSEDLPEPVPPIPPAPVYSTQLVKFFELDTTLAHPFDTLLRTTYLYDASGRLTQQSDFHTRPNGDSLQTITNQFEYTGNDTLASRQTTLYDYYYSGKQEKITAYFTFINGRYMNDSIWYEGSGTGYSKVSYSYESGVTTRTLFNLINFNPGTSSASDVNRQYISKLNDNIVQSIDSGKSVVVNNSLINYSRMEISTSYLPNPNPFFKMRPVRLDYVFSMNLGNPSSASYCPKNLIREVSFNFKSWTQSTPQEQSNSSAKYEYTFRADGYPLEARYTTLNPQPWGERTRKWVFVYKK